MQNDIKYKDPAQNKGKVVVGFFLLVAGGLLLLQQLSGIRFASWLFDWPAFLILMGLYTGVKHNFQKPAAYVLIGIGSFFLLNDLLPDFNISHLFWPLLVIGFGLMLILGRNHKWDKNRFKKRSPYGDSFAGNQKQYDWDKKVNPDNPNEPADDFTKTDYTKADYTKTGYTYQNYSERKADPNYTSEDYLDATSIFGSANKTILSKSFKGGEIINIFGGAEIDFTQADISGRVIIDVTQIFGGVKLLIPPHWHVTSDIVALFAGFDDKRKQKTDVSTDKVLVITGTSIFAGIEIRSY